MSRRLLPLQRITCRAECHNVGPGSSRIDSLLQALWLEAAQEVHMDTGLLGLSAQQQHQLVWQVEHFQDLPIVRQSQDLVFAYQNFKARYN